jgi:O-antigen ligase
MFLVGALLVQQDAFLNIPRVLQGRDAADASGVTTDPINVILVAATLAGLAVLINLRREAFFTTAFKNLPVIALCGLVFVSSLWSVAMGLSAKRAVVHLNTILLALYVASRMDFDQAVRCVAQSIAIGAVGSLIAGLGFHTIGLMHTPGLVGKWRGVYSHKNPLAQAMGLGVVFELYLCVRGPRRPLHGSLLVLETLLIVLSNSITVLLIVLLSLAAFGAYFLVRRPGALRRITLVLAPLAVGAPLLALIDHPTLLATLAGRDASLSGRTELWSGVVHAILQRPVLGYGFQSFWDSGEPLALEIWTAIGWNAPNSHNGLLEVALCLGLVGVLFVGAVLLQALARAARLLVTREFSLQGALGTIILGGILLESATEAVFLRQGDIDWLVLNLTSFLCAVLWASRPDAGLPMVRSVLERARPLADAAG